MRHRTKTVKLGRTSQHRDSMLANLVGSLILNSRIKTTLAKAKAVRPVAEKMVTLGKKGSLHHRRLAVAELGNSAWVRKLFADVAPKFKEREGGYTRILKLGPRRSDAAPMALIEWVEADVAKVEAEKVSEETKGKATAKKAAAKKSATKKAPAAEKVEDKAPVEEKSSSDEKASAEAKAPAKKAVKKAAKKKAD